VFLGSSTPWPPQGGQDAWVGEEERIPPPDPLKGDMSAWVGEEERIPPPGPLKGDKISLMPLEKPKP